MGGSDLLPQQLCCLPKWGGGGRSKGNHQLPTAKKWRNGCMGRGFPWPQEHWEVPKFPQPSYHLSDPPWTHNSFC